MYFHIHTECSGRRWRRDRADSLCACTEANYSPAGSESRYHKIIQRKTSDRQYRDAAFPLQATCMHFNNHAYRPNVIPQQILVIEAIDTIVDCIHTLKLMREPYEFNRK